MVDQVTTANPISAEKQARKWKIGPTIFWNTLVVALKYGAWGTLWALVGIWVPWLALALTTTPILLKLSAASLTGTLIGASSPAALRAYSRRIVPYAIPAALVLSLTPLGAANAIVVAIMIANIHLGTLAKATKYLKHEEGWGEPNPSPLSADELIAWVEFYLAIAALFAVRYSDPMIREYAALP